MIKRHYSIDDFEIVKCFTYTSTIPYNSTIIEIDANAYERFPNCREIFDAFYSELQKRAEEEWKNCGDSKSYFVFYDNKCVFQIRHKFSHRTYFIGRYDSRRAIGTKCHVYEGRIFDFKTMRSTDIVEDIKADEMNMWQKFTF